MPRQAWQDLLYAKPGVGAGGGTAAPAPAAAPARPASAISIEKMLDEASRLAGVEDSRFQTEYGRLGKAAGDFNKGFETDESRMTSLSLGSSLDSIGQGAVDQSRQMRTQLGGRGIDASSGLATMLADRIGLQQANLKYGAMRNAAVDSYQRRNAHRTAQYAQQAGIAQFGNQSPSLLRLDALTSGAEFNIASETADKELAAAKYGAKKSAQAAKSNGIANIIASFI